MQAGVQAHTPMGKTEHHGELFLEIWQIRVAAVLRRSGASPLTGMLKSRDRDDHRAGS